MLLRIDRAEWIRSREAGANNGRGRVTGRVAETAGTYLLEGATIDKNVVDHIVGPRGHAADPRENDPDDSDAWIELYPDYDWSALARRAWAASRAVDYLATLPEVDRTKIGLAGHSRNGKAAVWAGARDTRFAFVISNESGEGGAALSRRNFGETVQDLNTAFPHWFCVNYRKYNGRAQESQ